MKEKLKIIAVVIGIIVAIAVTCFNIPVRSIEIDDLSDEEIYVGENNGYIFDIDGGWFTSIKKLHIVSDNPEVADIECSYKGLSYVKFPMMSITPKSEGTMTFHIETKDGKIKSNETTITVKKRK